jgi:hypothetical protein
MALTIDDLTNAAQGMHPAQALEVARIAQLAVLDMINDPGTAALLGATPIGNFQQSLFARGIGSTDVDRIVNLYRSRQYSVLNRLIMAGTSWIAGAGASNAATTSARGLLNTRYAGKLTPVDASLGGTQTEAQVLPNLLSANAATPLGPGDIIGYEMGFNDYQSGAGASLSDSSPRHMAYLFKTFLATLAYLCTPKTISSVCSSFSGTNPAAPLTPAANPAVAYTGTWTFGYGTGSAKYRMIYNGTTATYVGSGDMLYVTVWRGYNGSANIGQILVDGVPFDSDNGRGTYAVTQFAPTLIRIPLSPGQHTVVIPGNVFHSEVNIFYRGKVPAQTVIVVPCVDVRTDARTANSNTTGASLQSAQVTALTAAGQVTPTSAALASIVGMTAPQSWWWEEGQIKRLQDLVRLAVSVMRSDGWEIACVENTSWDPMIHTADAGGTASAVYHPNDRGHYALHLPFADTIDRLLGLK